MGEFETREFPTKVVGVTLENEDGSSRQRVIEEAVAEGAPLRLRREAANPVDPNAIAVDAPDGRQIGYLRREVATEVSAALRAGGSVSATVLGVTGGDEHPTRGVNLMLRVWSPIGASAGRRASSKPGAGIGADSEVRAGVQQAKVGAESFTVLTVEASLIGLIVGVRTHDWWNGAGAFMLAIVAFGLVAMGERVANVAAAVIGLAWGAIAYYLAAGDGAYTGHALAFGAVAGLIGFGLHIFAFQYVRDLQRAKG